MMLREQAIPDAALPVPLTCFCGGARVQLDFMSLDAEHAQRLRTMGLREGTCFSIVQNEDKLIFHVGECRLGLRREVAMQLFGREVRR